MRADRDLDLRRTVGLDGKARVRVNKSHKTLCQIQNGLKLKLNGRSPRFEKSFVLVNSRLSEHAGDRLFLLNGKSTY